MYLPVRTLLKSQDLTRRDSLTTTNCSSSVNLTLEQTIACRMWLVKQVTLAVEYTLNPDIAVLFVSYVPHFFTAPSNELLDWALAVDQCVERLGVN